MSVVFCYVIINPDDERMAGRFVSLMIIVARIIFQQEEVDNEIFQMG